MTQKNTYNLTPALENTVVAIGNFDGVHEGHQHLIMQALDISDQEKLTFYVLTFSPHPRVFFNPSTQHTQLMTDTEKEIALLTYGADVVATLPFTEHVAALTPQQFEEDILINILSAKHIVVGENFRYGNKASGSVQTLQNNPNFTTHVVPLKGDEQGPFSSTRLRQNA